MLFPDLSDPPPRPTVKARSVRQSLRDAALDAVRTLQSALNGDLDMVQVRAACAILDRAGYGPHATVAVEDGRDLSRLSSEELYERAERVRQAIEQMTDGESDADAPSVH